ncbi:MAG: helix-turn-helix domain-containing protein [Bacteroidales bacterium]
MNDAIKKYPVQNPLLKNFIKFFWELRIENARLNHKIIPQRNINLRFNLGETPQYLSSNGQEHRLENVYFSGLHDQYRNTHLVQNGKVHVMGVCFFPDAFYPFFKIPVSEFKNQILGAGEIGFKLANAIGYQLKEADNITVRLAILEKELALLLVNYNLADGNFRKIFNALKQSENSIQISSFCDRNNIGVRSLERMFNKYVGVSANTYSTLNRFHNSMNQLLYTGYSKLSDLAYDNGYFDQMHFIKEFKRFAGNTPKSFIQQNNSILQIGKIT